MKREPIPVRIFRGILIALAFFPGLPLFGMMCVAGCLADRWSQRRR